LKGERLQKTTKKRLLVPPGVEPGGKDEGNKDAA